MLTGLFDPTAAPRGTAYIHCGLHKTGSTHLQAVCNHIAPLLAARGVFVPPPELGVSHHRIAHEVLRREDGRLGAAVASMPAGCPDLLLTCEDFEPLLVDDAAADFLVERLRSFGFRQVEFLFVTRDPGASFSSLIAEMCRHDVYFDVIQAFDEAMRTGRLVAPLAGTHPDRPTGGWIFIIDSMPAIRRFAGRVEASVLKLPYSCANPFPGADILRRVCGGSLPWLDSFDGAAFAGARNERLPADAIAAHYAQNVTRHFAHDPALAERIAGLVRANVPPPDVTAALAARLSAAFNADGNADAAFATTWAPDPSTVPAVDTLPAVTPVTVPAPPRARRSFWPLPAWRSV